MLTAETMPIQPVVSTMILDRDQNTLLKLDGVWDFPSINQINGSHPMNIAARLGADTLKTVGVSAELSLVAALDDGIHKLGVFALHKNNVRETLAIQDGFRDKALYLVGRPESFWHNLSRPRSIDLINEVSDAFNTWSSQSGGQLKYTSR